MPIRFTPAACLYEVTARAQTRQRLYD